MDPVKLARIGVVSIFVFAIAFVVFAATQVHQQVELEERLVNEGHRVEGKVVAKEQSERSAASSASASFFVDVRFELPGQGPVESTFSIDRSRYDTVSVGDAIDVTVLPEAPKLAQLTEVLGRPISGRGFVVQD